MFNYFNKCKVYNTLYLPVRTVEVKFSVESCVMHFCSFFHREAISINLQVFITISVNFVKYPVNSITYDYQFVDLEEFKFILL